MEELRNWRDRHRTIKIELLHVSKRIEGADPEDRLFYQEICEKYGYHLKRIEADCYKKTGVQMRGE
ncbi:hypothetical protein [Paenibacillus apiarius]|uniref:hypothetical protein n=1 Tax=Paenibacillus apiarius TaxID=46240 RepID=UPI00197F2626|nr:hypothetical protein [Paenibacillus apiarius]MBN3526530.1 hypothetical protein [Paenibacillus apiarius]